MISMKTAIKRFITVSLICVTYLFFLRGLAASAEPIDAENSPLEIQSDTMVAKGKDNIIVFEGSVIARKGSITLTAGTMTAIYDDNRTIDKVVAEDNVVLVQKDRTITANHAVYDSRNETVTFTGDPVFSEGQNTVTGTKIIYFIKEERSLVENSRVILHE